MFSQKKKVLNVLKAFFTKMGRRKICRSYPGLENLAAMPWSCHDCNTIMAKHGHDHAIMLAWRPCFLAWSSWFMVWSWYYYHVSMIHTMIMIWWTFFPSFFEKKWIVSVASVLGLLLIVYYCSRKLILLSGVCGHKPALSCKKVSKAYTVISFVNLPC